MIAPPIRIGYEISRGTRAGWNEASSLSHSVSETAASDKITVPRKIV
jgi:hypothetical protein